jgi:hypothetical protein
MAGEFYASGQTGLWTTNGTAAATLELTGISGGFNRRNAERLDGFDGETLVDDRWHSLGNT